MLVVARNAEMHLFEYILDRLCETYLGWFW